MPSAKPWWTVLSCRRRRYWKRLRGEATVHSHDWAHDRSAAFLPPDASWAPHFAEIQLHAPHWFQGTGTHDADPFVVALAKHERLLVVTYEGKKFSGDPAKISTVKRSMPHICRAVGVDVADIARSWSTWAWCFHDG